MCVFVDRERGKGRERESEGEGERESACVFIKFCVCGSIELGVDVLQVAVAFKLSKHCELHCGVICYCDMFMVSEYIAMKLKKQAAN